MPDQRRRIAHIDRWRRAADGPARRALVRELSDPDPLIRRLAAAALSEIGDAQAIPALMDLLRDPYAEVRLAAINALGSLQAVSAEPGAIALLVDPDPSVRRAAARALGLLGSSHAVAPLQAALSDRESRVRQAATHALERLARRRASPVLGTLQIAQARSAPVSRSTRPHRPIRTGYILFGMITGILTMLIGVLIWVWDRPLGPQLVPPIAYYPDPSPAPDAPPPLCDGPPHMFLLLIGLDAEEGHGASSADVIRLARIDFTAPSAAVLSIPRDLWVTIPGMAERGVPANRIKAAYAYGVHYGYPGGGPGLLALTLAESFGLPADHYVVGSFADFARTIDTVGGVDIYIPAPLSYSDRPDFGFEAGWHHMDGQTALLYVRMRPDNSSDLYRIERQTTLITALQRQVLDPRSLPTIPRLLHMAGDSVATDLSPADINALLCLAREIDPDSITFVDMDSALFTSVIDEFGFERLIPDQPVIRDLAARFAAGVVP
jgi:LCP family protein required for cell wall assembly